MSVQLQLSDMVAKLQERRPLQSLAPEQVWDASLEQAISTMVFHPEDARLERSKEIIALKAGLHLLNDSLDRSHSYSQEIEDDATGCYWHGIMHRMEGDYSNANYWFHGAGAHPVKSRLNAKVADWLQNGIILGELPDSAIRDTLVHMKGQRAWNPGAFTDLIQQQVSGQGSDETRSALEYIQHIEMLELLAHTLSAAEIKS
ncbi:hypothetical protein ACFPYJ_03370 [Paenibacillus solisilvae]|uniref:Uncharacterized protein n=1 Tax=Paenibacillus solisilvae TaxID=2486751 RepID=A0ABW0VSB7_9BACL